MNFKLNISQISKSPSPFNEQNVVNKSQKVTSTTELWVEEFRFTSEICVTRQEAAEVLQKIISSLIFLSQQRVFLVICS